MSYLSYSEDDVYESKDVEPLNGTSSIEVTTDKSDLQNTVLSQIWNESQLHNGIDEITELAETPVEVSVAGDTSASINEK